ncbi:MAG: hypothetical protein AAF665_05380 [Pseudomonadota bacterium]
MSWAVGFNAEKFIAASLQSLNAGPLKNADVAEHVEKIVSKLSAEGSIWAIWNSQNGNLSYQKEDLVGELEQLF